MGRRNRPRHTAPRRNRSSRAAAERRAIADRQREPSYRSLPARGRGTGSGVVKCPAGKTGFTEAEARRRLEEYATDPENNRRERPCRVYPCPKCDAWHLTAREA